MKKVKLLKRRVLAISMALAMMLSSLVVSQGVITAYAEEPTTDTIKAVGGITCPYSPTQIKNGNFETPPWEDFVLSDGTKYTSQDKKLPTTDISSIPNKVSLGYSFYL